MPQSEYEIIVVDNDSNDGAGEKITTEFPSVNWMYNSENEGFGRANNMGANAAKGNYLLFLNSDMLVPNNTIERCLDKMEQNDKIGVLGPQLLNEDGTLQKSCYYYVGEHAEILKDNLLLDKLISFKQPSLKAVMGSFMVIRKEVFTTVGGFDPDFFMYCEELDLCDRIRALGLEITYIDEVHAIHKHGGSSDREWSIRQTYLSRALLVYKRKGIGAYFVSHALFKFNFITNLFLMWLLDKDYRKGFWKSNRAYFFNWLTYWTIPFTFTRILGTGKKLLKSA